jgi:hypothetical protein
MSFETMAQSGKVARELNPLPIRSEPSMSNSAAGKQGDFVGMELSLTEDDARTLRDFLRDHLADLKFEVARTEAKSFRHALLARQELIERLLALLDREVPG